MQAYDLLHPDQATPFEGRDVFDRRGKKIGVVAAHWFNPSTDQVEFLGVRPGLLFGGCHLVPARSASIDPADDRVHLGVDEEIVLKAPTAIPHQGLAEVEKEEVNAYYHEFVPVERVTDIAEVRPEEALKPPPVTTPPPGKLENQFIPSEHTAVEEGLPADELTEERLESGPQPVKEPNPNDQQITKNS